MNKKLINLLIDNDLYQLILKLVNNNKVVYPSVSFVIRISIKRFLDALPKS